jgi:hypothetical protein
MAVIIRKLVHHHEGELTLMEDEILLVPFSHPFSTEDAPFPFFG